MLCAEGARGEGHGLVSTHTHSPSYILRYVRTYAGECLLGGAWPSQTDPPGLFFVVVLGGFIVFVIFTLLVGGQEKGAVFFLSTPPSAAMVEEGGVDRWREREKPPPPPDSVSHGRVFGYPMGRSACNLRVSLCVWYAGLRCASVMDVVWSGLVCMEPDPNPRSSTTAPPSSSGKIGGNIQGTGHGARRGFSRVERRCETRVKVGLGSSFGFRFSLVVSGWLAGWLAGTGEGMALGNTRVGAGRFARYF